MALADDQFCNAQSPCHAVQISEHVYWVGAIDWAIRDFHGYLTERGTTYNAYLILADKVTLIDTVKAPFRQELLARIASVIDPKRIDYIISNHAEMDHSGCLPELIRAVKPEKVFASALGVKALDEHFHLDYHFIPVKDGETLSLGDLQRVFRRDAHGALAGQHVHLPARRWRALFQRRLRHAPGRHGALRR